MQKSYLKHLIITLGGANKNKNKTKFTTELVIIELLGAYHWCFADHKIDTTFVLSNTRLKLYYITRKIL